jgi:hypothetical protein
MDAVTHASSINLFRLESLLCDLHQPEHSPEFVI